MVQNHLASQLIESLICLIFCKEQKEVLTRIKNTISRNDQQILLKIYNSVFNDNKKMTSCGSCINSTLNKLKQVYDKSCKIWKNKYLDSVADV